MVTSDATMLGKVLAFMIVQMHNVVCLISIDVPVDEVAHDPLRNP